MAARFASSLTAARPHRDSRSFAAAGRWPPDVRRHSNEYQASARERRRHGGAGERGGEGSRPATSKGGHDEVLLHDGRRSPVRTARAFGGGGGADSDPIGGAGEGPPPDGLRRAAGGLRP